MANETVQYLDVEVRLSALVTGLDGVQMQKEFVRKVRFADGTGNNQVGQVWLDGARSLNATSENLDLSGTTLDFKGAALDMNSVAVVFVENLDTDTGDTITVAMHATTGVTGIFGAASDAITVQPGGFLLWVAPGPDKAAVVAGTGDLITITAADNSTYNVLIAGDNT